MAYNKDELQAMVDEINALDIPGVHKVAKPRKDPAVLVGRVIGFVLIGLTAAAAATAILWGVVAMWRGILG